MYRYGVSGRKDAGTAEAEEAFRKKELLLWLRQLSEILEYLHSRTPPLIHGDIKPSNLMIGPGGRLVLLDFGACLSLGKEKRERYGTKVFAAPEQLDEKLEPDIRSDFYSAGKTFRFLSGGKESPGFRRFLDICMQEDRSRRFSDDRKLQRRLLRVCRKGKRNCLLFSFLAVFLLFFGSIIHIRRQNRTAEEQYQILMESSQTEELVSAIRLFPIGKRLIRNYCKLIFWIRYLPGKRAGNWRNSWFLGRKTGKGGLWRLAYELGIAYWYYFQQAEGKNYAGLV